MHHFLKENMGNAFKKERYGRWLFCCDRYVQKKGLKIHITNSYGCRKFNIMQSILWNIQYHVYELEDLNLNHRVARRFQQRSGFCWMTSPTHNLWLSLHGCCTSYRRHKLFPTFNNNHLHSYRCALLWVYEHFPTVRL